MAFNSMRGHQLGLGVGVGVGCGLANPDPNHNLRAWFDPNPNPNPNPNPHQVRGQFLLRLDATDCSRLQQAAAREARALLAVRVPPPAVLVAAADEALGVGCAVGQLLAEARAEDGLGGCCCGTREWRCAPWRRGRG